MQREQFETWLKSKPEAMYWNTTDAMFSAWCAAVEAAAHRLEEEAKYECPCNEDERLTWENADMLREWAGLPKRNTETPNVEVSGLRGFSRRSARLPGWAAADATARRAELPARPPKAQHRSPRLMRQKRHGRNEERPRA